MDLLDTNYAYTKFDNFIDRILSNIQTLEHEFKKSDHDKSKIIGGYYKILEYKTRQVYDTLMNINDLNIATTIQYHRKYHGPYRIEIGEGLFDENRRNVTYHFESYLAQLKTLIDLTVKFAFEICFLHNTTPEIIDSMGKFFTRIYEKKQCKKIKNIWLVMRQSKYFSDIVTKRNQLYEVENYRNHIIHHGILNLKISQIPNQKEVLFNYLIPHVTWKNKRLVISSKNYDNLTNFCRKKYFLILDILLNLTSNMYDKSLIRNHLKELLLFRHEDVLEILKKLSRKGRWPEKWFKNEKLAKIYLKNNNIGLEELVIGEHKKNDRGKTDDPDLVNIDERITYKPIKGMEIFKTKHVIGRGTELKTFGWNYHIRHIITTEDEYSKISDSEQILECLRKSNLIYLTSKEPKKYGALNDDLKNFLVELENINMTKWSEIQYQERTHFRNPYPDEYEELAKHHKNKKDFEKYLQKYEQDRKRTQQEYENWKKDPSENRPIRFRYKNRKHLGVISKKDFLNEKKIDFENWKKNNLIITKPNSKKILRHLTDKTPEEFIKECKTFWTRNRYSYSDHLKKNIKQDRRYYQKRIKEIKQKNNFIIKKYSILKPILKLMNYDICANNVDFSVVNAKNWIPVDSWIYKDLKSDLNQ